MIPKKWSVPLLEHLIPDGLSSGIQILVEYDPEGQWFAISRTITALRVKSNLRVQYGATARPREELISSLAKLGVDVDEAEKVGLLRIDDHYSSTLSIDKDNPGFVAVEDRYLRVGSPKITDWSIDMGRSLRGGASNLSKWGPDQSDVLSIADSFSPLLRLNEEKAFLEFLETRSLPLQRKLSRIEIDGIANRVHSESLYARLEGAYDGLIEVRAMERNEEIKNMLRIRNLKGQPHDARWHEIEIKSNGEAELGS